MAKTNQAPKETGPETPRTIGGAAEAPGLAEDLSEAASENLCDVSLSQDAPFGDGLPEQDKRPAPESKEQREARKFAAKFFDRSLAINRRAEMARKIAHAVLQNDRLFMSIKGEPFDNQKIDGKPVGAHIARKSWEMAGDFNAELETLYKAAIDTAAEEIVKEMGLERRPDAAE